MASASSVATACFLSPPPPARAPFPQAPRVPRPRPAPSRSPLFHGCFETWWTSPRPRGGCWRPSRAPLVVAVASAAQILGGPGSTSAFVVAIPWKLQAYELATVRLFKDNTPSVVYITNLAVRQDAFTLDVLEVPQGSGLGFVWDKIGHIVTNFHVIRSASDLRLVHHIPALIANLQQRFKP